MKPYQVYRDTMSDFEYDARALCPAVWSKTWLRLRNPIVTGDCVRELERLKLAIPFNREKFSHMIKFECSAVFISTSALYSVPTNYGKLMRISQSTAFPAMR